MKPAAFAYLAPRGVEEAVDQLATHGAEARVLAGGQSLVRLMNTRMATPSVLVDINRIAELDQLDSDGDAIRIGATVRQRGCELARLVRDHLPLLAEAGAQVAHTAIRQRGTVVGSIAFADPSAELPAALLALDGQVVVRGQRGERLIDAEDFFVGPFANSLEPDELAIALRIPRTPAGRTGSAFLEVSRRQGDLPVCGVGAIVQLDGNDAVALARIALCGVHQRPIRVHDAEAALLGGEPTDEQLEQAAHLAATAADPIDDCHGSANFRRHLARVLTRRALLTALDRARREDRADA